MYEQTNKQHCVKNVSWNAIITGALVAIGLLFLFQLLTIGIGLSSFTSTINGIEALAVGGFIWLFIGSYIILFLAGWVTGNLANITHSICQRGALHGFLAWTLALLISLIIAGEFKNSSTTIQTGTPTAATNINVLTSNPYHGGNTQIVSSGTQEMIHSVGITTLSTFLIILVGALGSCVGGYMGAKHRKECETQHSSTTETNKNQTS